MSRIDELKKQYKEFALCDLDIMKMVVPDQANKYAEVLAKLTKNHIETSYFGNREGGITAFRTEILQTLVSNYGLDYAYLETLETPILLTLYLRMEVLVGSNKVKLFNKFANLNERGLIDNNDITSYKSFDELEQAISLAEIKLIDKKLVKQIIKVHEDDEWLLLKPLSLEASMKYGAGTKWCTTMDSGTYFARYSRWGILIYAINKKTGFKFATFKNLDSTRDNEFSFWNAADNKIDPLEVMEIPIEILNIIRYEVTTNRITNKGLMDEATQKKLHAYENPEDSLIQPQQEGNVFRFTGTSTGTTLVNPNYFTNTNINNTNNIGMATTTPNTQLEIGGDIVVREGSIRMTDNEGVERMRITSSGFEVPGDIAPSLYSEQIEQTRQDLFREMEQHLERAEEHVIQQREVERDNLLRNLELGTVDEQYIKRMQLLAGIDTKGDVAKLNKTADEEEAEQPDVPSEQQRSIFTRLKNWISRQK